MSKFVTPFPFSLDEMKAMLPKGSHFEAIKWNKEQTRLELHWEHDPFRTGRDHPIDFPPLMLQLGTWPDGVTVDANALEFERCGAPFPPPFGKDDPNPPKPDFYCVLPKGHEGSHANPDPVSDPGAPQSRQVRTGEGDKVPKKPAKAKGKAD